MNIPIGEWQGTVRTWLGPDPVHSDITATTERVLEGKSTRIAYRSTVTGKRADGWMILGEDIATPGRQCITWIDTFHTGSNVGNFAADESGTFHGSYAAGDQVWRWRIEISAGEELRIEHFNISPAGEEDRAIEVILKAAAPRQ